MSLTCPYCKKNPASNVRGTWPFCSERCKKLDLGAWANENYTIPVIEHDQDDEESVEDISNDS